VKLGDLGLDTSAETAMDGRALLEQARQRTGLGDFGSDDFLEPFELLVDELKAAPFSALGRRLKTQEIIVWLENRLRLTEARRLHPAIDGVAVEAPIFITGLPRTGTSIVFELMSLSGALRSPTQLEAAFPWDRVPGLPGVRAGERGQHERLILASSRLAPELRAKHETGPEVPAECVYFTAPSFRSALASGGALTPRYNAWLAAADRRPEYDFHRRWLQLLTWCDARSAATPGCRWLLKGPAHLATLAALEQGYPDALIIQTHRDPCAVIPSLASLAGTLQSVYFEAPFAGEAFAAGYAERIIEQLGTVLEARSNAVPGRYVDLRYSDFMAAPVAALGEVFASLDISLDDDERERMRDYLVHKPSDKFGRHSYPPLAGALQQRVRRALRDYMKAFQTPVEAG
jgi:hypothetical protein